MSSHMKNGIARALAILLCSLLSPMAKPQDLTLPLAATDPVILRVPNGTPHPKMLEVTLLGADTPIAGRYEFNGDIIRFTPAFGFDAGRDYVVRLPNDNDAVPFRISTDTAQLAPSVTQIYPSGDTLPENTLRFYIHFSAPMQPHVAFDYIKLRDASGTADEAAFMRFKQELWNEDRTRLTVLIDPGRIKRDVATNVELGPALLAGQQYTLVVEDGWLTADGSTVLPAFTKTFQVSQALRSRPNTRQWSTNVPCVGTREPLTVAFDRPFDRHLLIRSLRVKDSEGSVIEGKIDVDVAERLWHLEPDQPWPADGLRLIADTTLEDVAGNNFHDLLDHVVGEEESGISSSELRISTRNCTG